MSNRKYKFIVAIQISMIALLSLFVLNAEQLLETIRNGSSIETNYQQDSAWKTVYLSRPGSPGSKLNFQLQIRTDHPV